MELDIKFAPVFSSDNAHIDELKFITGDNDKNALDKKYLLRKSVKIENSEKGIDKAKYMKIKALNSDDRDRHTDIVAFKSLLNSMGKCEGAVIFNENEIISGGFITFSQKISLITDVYTNDKHRNQGYGKRIVEKLSSNYFNIFLDVNGKEMSSEELAKYTQKLVDEGRGNICFVIAGSLGFSKDALNRADFRLSFSKMTFTHQMIRLLLLEQIYRVFKINNNEVYHK